MSHFTRAQARMVAHINAEASRLIREGHWTLPEFNRLRHQIQEIAPRFGDAQNHLIGLALPEWFEDPPCLPKASSPPTTDGPDACSETVSSARGRGSPT